MRPDFNDGLLKKRKKKVLARLKNKRSLTLGPFVLQAEKLL